MGGQKDRRVCARGRDGILIIRELLTPIAKYTLAHYRRRFSTNHATGFPPPPLKELRSCPLDSVRACGAVESLERI